MMVESILSSLGSGFLRLDKKFIFGPQGILFKRNLEQLWYQNCVVMPPYNVFLFQNDKVAKDDDEKYEEYKISNLEDTPVGIAMIEDTKIHDWNSELPFQSKLSHHKIAKVSILCDPIIGKDLYHRKQRERKVWWRKFSREPSRFKFTESKKDSRSKDFIDISAEFPFGSIVLETISYHQDIRRIPSQISIAENLPPLNIIEHTASLDWGSLALLCDAFNSNELNLHPKLSPYKAGFYLNSNEGDSKAQEMKHFILYLNNVLKSKCIETIAVSNIQQLKIFQVPLIISIDENSLQNGIINVCNKLTSLNESVHITDLPKYIINRS